MSSKEKKAADTMETWLGLLGDAERADVLKTQIAEEAKTERARIEQEEQTRRANTSTEGFHIVKGMWNPHRQGDVGHRCPVRHRGDHLRGLPRDPVVAGSERDPGQGRTPGCLPERERARSARFSGSEVGWDHAEAAPLPARCLRQWPPRPD